MNLLIQRWMRAAQGPDVMLMGLKERYCIGHRRHHRYPNLVSFKYDQLTSPFSEPIVRECRGIVLDENENWNVVARGFDKFFNHGEGHAASIDWSTARVQEKVDGSLCCVYEYDGAWHVATTGTPDGGGDVNRSGVTFADYFWRTLAAMGCRMPPNGTMAGGYTFMFELSGDINRVVVLHDKPHVTLLGARSLSLGVELTTAQACGLIEACDGLCPPAVREFALGSFDDITATFAELSPLKQEGYVVVDGAFNRVKVKHPGYVALHHARDGLTTRAFVQIARTGEVSELIAAFPEYAPKLEDARARFSALVAEVDADYARVRHIESMKDFALEAQKTRCQHALFAVHRKKVASVVEYMREMRLETLVEMLGYGAEPEPAKEAA